MSGAWVVVGTRVPADAIIAHFDDGFSLEEIVTEIFPSVPFSRAQRLLAYSRDDIGDAEVEDWLRTEVVKTYDAHKTDPSRASSADEVLARLEARSSGKRPSARGV